MTDATGARADTVRWLCACRSTRCRRSRRSPAPPSPTSCSSCRPPTATASRRSPRGPRSRRRRRRRAARRARACTASTRSSRCASPSTATRPSPSTTSGAPRASASATPSSTAWSTSSSSRRKASQADVGAAVAHLREQGAHRVHRRLLPRRPRTRGWRARRTTSPAPSASTGARPGATARPARQRAGELRGAAARRSWAAPTRRSPPTTSRRSRPALADAGVEHEIVTYDGAPHSFFDRRHEQHAEASEDAWQRYSASSRGTPPSDGHHRTSPPTASPSPTRRATASSPASSPRVRSPACSSSAGRCGPSLRWSDIAVFVILYALTGLGVTVGFHRLPHPPRFKTTPAGPRGARDPRLGGDRGAGHLLGRRPPQAPRLLRPARATRTARTSTTAAAGAARCAACCTRTSAGCSSTRSAARRERYAPDLLADPVDPLRRPHVPGLGDRRAGCAVRARLADRRHAATRR